MHSKYDNMHMNGMFYALICINNYIITSLSCMSLGGELISLSIYVFLTTFMNFFIMHSN